MDPWIAEHADRIAARAARELEALVAVSSPSGDAPSADEAVAVAAALLPDGAGVERLECSSPGHARDLLARFQGTGEGRLLLLGHLDTVIAHDQHRPLERDGERLVGSGSIDMKGGVVLSLGVLRALASDPSSFAEVALLLVVDEEWRTAPFRHVERFAGFDACLCFEAGELDAEGRDAVVVERKAAGTIRVRAHGRSAHSGSAPDKGANALLALADAARVVAAHHDPTGPQRLTAVPTVVRSGEAFNVVPADGELICDVRAEGARGVRRDPHRVARGGGWRGARGADGARLAGDARVGGDRAPAGGRRRRPRAPGGGRTPRRRQRREPLRVGDPGDGGRPRPTWWRGPRAARVRARELAAQPGGGRPGDIAGRPGLILRKSASIHKAAASCTLPRSF